MRIAYVVPGLDPFGPILVVKSLVEIMQSMGHDVSVYYLKNRITEMRMPCRVHKVGTGSQIALVLIGMLVNCTPIFTDGNGLAQYIKTLLRIWVLYIHVRWLMC